MSVRKELKNIWEEGNLGELDLQKRKGRTELLKCTKMVIGGDKLA